MSKKEKTKKLMEEVAKKMSEAEDWEKILPSNRRYQEKQRGPRPASKSYERHMRETDEKIAQELGVSATILRRVRFISKYGSEELKRMCRQDKIAITKAYEIAKREQDTKLFKAMEAVMKGRKGKENE